MILQGEKRGQKGEGYDKLLKETKRENGKFKRTQSGIYLKNYYRDVGVTKGRQIIEEMQKTVKENRKNIDIVVKKQLQDELS